MLLFTEGPITHGGRELMLEQNREIARRLTEEVWRGKLDVIDDLLADGYTDHDPSPGQGQGIEGYREMVRYFYSALPDLRATNEDVIVEGDRVVARWTATGTHRGDLMGIAPTGRGVTLKGIDILRISGGRIVERWGEFDALGLLQQLGAVPAGTGAEG